MFSIIKLHFLLSKTLTSIKMISKFNTKELARTCSDKVSALGLSSTRYDGEFRSARPVFSEESL